VPEVFESNGFHRMEKERFPQKVWSDCAVCPKRECCDEIAMVRELP